MFLARLSLISFFVVASVLLPLTAAAQGGMDEEEVKQFEALVTEAAQYQEEGAHEEAIEKFEAATEIHDHPRLQVAIANSYLALDDCHSAEATYVQLLLRDNLRDDLRARVQQELRDIRPCPDEGRVIVECGDTDRDIIVELRRDGSTEREGLCPANWKVPEDRYELIARSGDIPSARQTISVHRGKTTEESVEIGIADDQSTRSTLPPWTRYASYGSLAVGAGLVTAAVISDMGAPERAAQLRQARENQHNVEEWIAYNEAIRARTIFFYTSGAILTVAGASLLTWNLLGRSGGTEESLRWSLRPSPTGFSLQIRW